MLVLLKKTKNGNSNNCNYYNGLECFNSVVKKKIGAKSNMKVAIYVRVSKEEVGLQDPDNQLQPLRKFCESMSWEIREEFIDRASGGSADRPNFQKMLNRVRQKYYDLVLVWSLDRFSREGMINTLKYIEVLRNHKTGLKSLQEPWLDTTQEGVSELLLAFMSWVAQQERKRISERTKAGLSKLKAQGKILGRPKGWRGRTYKTKIKGVKNPAYKN